MRIHSIVLTLSAMLTISVPGLSYAISESSQDITTEPAAPLTETSLEHAAVEGWLDKYLPRSLGAQPSAQDLTRLENTLRHLAQTNPNVVVLATSTIAQMAINLAGQAPQTAISLVQIVLGLLDDPKVSSANRVQTADALVSSTKAVALARKAASATNTQLVCSIPIDTKDDDNSAPCDERLLSYIDFLAGDPGLTDAVPDLLDQITLAQINPGMLVTAAGGNGPVSNSFSIPILPPITSQYVLSATTCVCKR